MSWNRGQALENIAYHCAYSEYTQVRELRFVGVASFE